MTDNNATEREKEREREREIGMRESGMKTKCVYVSKNKCIKVSEREGKRA